MLFSATGKVVVQVNAFAIHVSDLFVLVLECSDLYITLEKLNYKFLFQ